MDLRERVSERRCHAMHATKREARGRGSFGSDRESAFCSEGKVLSVATESEQQPYFRTAWLSLSFSVGPVVFGDSNFPTRGVSCVVYRSLEGESARPS